MQHASVSDLIFGVSKLISYISQCTRLHPGDLLLTGTPGGVGAFRESLLWLQAGDEVTVEITRVRTLRNPVEDEKPA